MVFDQLVLAYIFICLCNIDTVGEKLHAERELALEGINLETFFFESRKVLFKLLVCLIRPCLLSKRFQKHGIAMRLAVQA